MKLLIIFFVLINISKANACSVELFSKIYRLENTQTLSSRDIIYKTDCGNEVSMKLTQILSSASGILTASFLEKEFSNQNVSILPRKISLLNFNNTLKDQLSANSNLYFLNISSMNQLQSLGLIEGESLKAICESCGNIGEKNIKIDITNPIANTTRTLWFSSRLSAKVKVFKAKRNLSFQEKSLSIEDFYTEDAYTSMPQNVMTQIENIQFFKPNKTITQGSIITNMDIQPVNLVNYGVPVKLILKNQSISLTKNGMPGRSAQFGDTIEVQTNNSNKKVLGRVVDYNKVVIEL